MRIPQRRSLAVLPAALALAAGSAAACAAGPADQGVQARRVAAAASFERGPAPTEQSVTGALGPFSYSRVTVTDAASTGFGGGTIYYPDDLGQGTFGGIAVSPGYTARESSIAWLGPRLASQGFVVITITTDGLYDQPTARGRQLLAALDHLRTKAPAEVARRLDPQRLAVAGHSMGGGGALYAAWSRPALKASIPLAPYQTIKDWSGTRVPTMIIGGTRDTVTPVGQHAERFYTSMTAAPERYYAEVADADHVAFTREDPVVGGLAVAWAKRFVDGDARYEPFLCPAPLGTARLTEYRNSCPTG
ncbi:alpha/beta hydrolase family protein [Spirillospora sp. NPDC050679]